MLPPFELLQHWQGRFSSYVDQSHLIAAAQYVELNPIKASLAQHPGDYKWSSARAHLSGKDDDLVVAEPLLKMVSDWRRLLASGMVEDDETAIRKHSRTGRPLRNRDFIDEIEKLLGQPVRPQKPGPKTKR